MQRGACVTCARHGAGRRNRRNNSISFLFSYVPRGAAFCWSAGGLRAEAFRGGCRGTSFRNKTALPGLGVSPAGCPELPPRVRSTPLLGLGSRLSACFLSPLPGSSRSEF